LEETNLLNPRKLRAVRGWLARTDFEICKTLLLAQNEIADSKGAVVEIGVHHGKSFVVFAEFSGNSKLYAIDIFEDQAKNIDGSGSGSKEIFLKNLDVFSVDKSRVVIDPRMSNEVQAADITNRVGGVRFFHIDGGHHYGAVANDLQLAVNVIAPSGIIAIDDVFRPEWPEVSAATFGSGILEANNLACFAIGFNKSYFCKKAYVARYQEALKGSAFLRFYMTKTYKPKDDVVLIYQRYPLPEWGIRTILSWAMSIYVPDLFVALSSFGRGVKPPIKRLARR
jgi:hypothetical protein